MIGTVDSVIGPVPQVGTWLSRADRRGALLVRLGVGRDCYTVEPGLYAIGWPGAGSPLLVTANYKLSFDHLRQAMAGRAVWLLALDTKGINVWCAAGKGTFGTEELVARIAACRLDRLLRHRRLVLPQLGAPGVAAHEVRRRSGFAVCYGPIRAADLPSFLDRGYRATPVMRRQTFPLRQRLILVPVELLGAMRPGIFVLFSLFLLGGLGAGGLGYWQSALRFGGPAGLAIFAGIVGGTVITPLLLPWLPGRAFAVKGATAGVIAAAVLPAARQMAGGSVAWWQQAALMVMTVATASYWGMKFTGASTYTSLSGVKREMHFALPLQIVLALVGVGGWLSWLFRG